MSLEQEQTSSTSSTTSSNSSSMSGHWTGKQGEFTALSKVAVECIRGQEPCSGSSRVTNDQHGRTNGLAFAEGGGEGSSD